MEKTTYKLENDEIVSQADTFNESARRSSGTIELNGKHYDILRCDSNIQDQIKIMTFTVRAAK